MNTAIEILQKYWNHTSFRPLQDEIINAVLSNKDTISLLPTGGGKSICFQVPALLKDGICIVISPLIALMQDQVESLKEKGIKATVIASGSSQNDIITLFDNLKYGNYKFLYISPERLQSPFIQQKIKELSVNLIAVDEAHCISEWGHDFRPSYRNISVLKELIPSVPFIALTATATKIVIEDIATNLALKQPAIFKKSFSRTNLAYRIITTEDKLQYLKKILINKKTPAIVYINSRKKTEEIARFLNANGFLCGFYHGGLSKQEKNQSFKNWMSEKTPIMIATNAFGMGIDKDNVSKVIHLNLPSSIENYIQEAGRAGRNDENAVSYILQNENDIFLFKEQIENSLPNIPEIKEVHKKLYQHFNIANGEIFESSFLFNYVDFCKKYNFTPYKVDAILKILNNNGILEISYNFNKKSSVQFIANSKKVIHFGNTKTKELIRVLLRSYAGLFEQEKHIDEYLLSKKIGQTTSFIIKTLHQLEKEEILTYKRASNDAEITFLIPREDDKTINRISKNIEKYIHQKRKKAGDLIRFIQNDTICRNVQILSYFDEKKPQKCGICDVCLDDVKNNSVQLSTEILSQFKKGTFYSSQEISTLLRANEKEILIHLRALLASEVLSINKQNKFYKK